MFMRRLIVIIIILITTNIARANDTMPVALLRTTEIPNTALDAVVFSPDGNFIATGGRDSAINVWDLRTGELIRTLQGHSDWVTTIAFNHDSTRLISGSRDNSVRIFNMQSGELLTVITTHQDVVNAVSVTPNGQFIASGGRDGLIYIHDMNAQQIAELSQFEQPVWDIAFSPDGTTLATSSEDGKVWLWGLFGADGNWLQQLVAHETPVSSVSFSADGRYIITGGLDGITHVWDVQGIKTHQAIEPIATMTGHVAPISGVVMSDNNRVVITASLDGSVRFWDFAGEYQYGAEIGKIFTDSAPISALAIAPSRATIATVTTTGRLSIWDTSPQSLDVVYVRLNVPDTPVEEAPQVAIRPPTEQPFVVPTLIPTVTPIPNIAQPQAPNIPSIPYDLSDTGEILSIPSVNMDVEVRTFPLNRSIGTWDIDPWEQLAGHLEHTSWIDTGGNVVIGAHSQYPNGVDGVFASLYDVGIGDEIFVRDGNYQRRYVVVNIRSVDYRDVSVVMPTDISQLTLFTCDIPSYVAEQNLYFERLVVVAQEVP